MANLGEVEGADLEREEDLVWEEGQGPGHLEVVQLVVWVVGEVKVEGSAGEMVETWEGEVLI